MTTVFAFKKRGLRLNYKSRLLSRGAGFTLAIRYSPLALFLNAVAFEQGINSGFSSTEAFVEVHRFLGAATL